MSADEVGESFSQVVGQASARVREILGVSIQNDRTGVVALEELISRMWREGWDPEKADLNLFVRDLGSLFMSILETMTGAEPVFRSRTDLSHASLWLPKKHLEVFPLHKMYRRLTSADGESLAFFVDKLVQQASV